MSGQLPERNIVIVGCGYIGQQIADQYKLMSAAQPTITCITGKSQARHLPAININLDDELAKLPPSVPIAGSILYYLVPPPNTGTRDTRISNFFKLISGVKPHKIILISTTSVYGNCHGNWITEATPVKPQIDRARRRLDAEQQLKAYCEPRHVNRIVLRVAGIYGPGKLPLERLKQQLPIVREADSPYSNRIHAEDLTTICVAAGLQEQLSGIYNCADGNPTTMYDYFIRVAQAAKLPEPPAISLAEAQQVLSRGMLSYMAESRRIDNSKLLKDFGLQLKFPDLNKGLQ